MSDTPPTTDPYQDDPLDDGGSEEEFVRLFAKDRRRIYSYVYSAVPIASEAEDVFQQVSLVLWRRFDSRDREKSFYEWACGVAYYTLLNYRRKLRRSRLVFGDELFDKLAAERIEWEEAQVERSSFLRECVDRLRTPDRELIAKIYHDGLSPQAVADETGRTRQGVYNRLSFIRKRLLECVSNKIAANSRST